jgi:microcystin degradation protein MlrC
MPPRVGIVALQHESNTFLGRPTTLADFTAGRLLDGEAVRAAFAGIPHEVGGFFAGLAAEAVEAVPVFAAWAVPSGTIAADAADELVRRLLAAVERAGPLDGWLVAPHGAAVAENHADFDGHWLALLRERVGAGVPVVGTLDLHANLSPRTVAVCDALIAYRTNPHLDQFERGAEAAALIGSAARGEVRPVTAARFPPLVANIERQATAEPHWRPLLDLAERQREHGGALSNSLVCGFPYADVPEMGSAVLAVTDDDPALAGRLADELASLWWEGRADFAGELVSVADALDRVERLDGSVCLLDMGDNVGGGSPGDGTVIAHALHARRLGPGVAVLFDPEAVRAADAAGVGSRLRLSMGGRTDDRHGPPLAAEVTVVAVTDGRWEEPAVRHGGIRHYDQGRTAAVRTDAGLTVVLTSRRTPPFSLGQLTSCGLDPAAFRVLVAKGVHAPVAAYAPVCRHLVRVNTPGVTTADMAALPYRHRRRPLYPLEPDATFPP